MERCSQCTQILTKAASADGLCVVCLLEQGLQTFVQDGDDTFGPYEVLCQIGEGGMGVAYLVEQKRPIRREVALKVLKPGLSSPDVIARFETECQALALMDHPNIARVFDAGTSAKKRPYLVMEFIDGSPITEYCDRKALTISQRLALFVQVCHAVDHAHRKGIIHRDIKPSNVLVTEIDRIPVPKVIDFGIAKAVGGSHIGQSVTAAEGQLIGTLGYMSPEQVSMSPAPPDARTDVYSLGILLYELLCGTPPFDTNRLRQAGVVGAAQIVCKDEAPSPSTRLREMGAKAGEVARARGVGTQILPRVLSGDLTWIVHKALEKDRDRRYPTPAELAADIDRYLRHEPVLAGAPGPLYRARKLLRRYRVPLTSAVAAGAAIATTLLLFRSSPHPPLQAVPLTAYTGDETSPTFSPDESEIAFTWNGEAQDNYDIYALRIGDSAPRRLTSDPATEYSPVWSPDGKWIAFLRAKVGRNPEVVLINPRNGFERRLADARIVVNPQHHRLDWSADSRWLVLAQRGESGGPDRIYALAVDTQEQRPLSSPKTGEFDNSPSVSSDGRLLAFIRDASQFSSSIVVLPLGSDFRLSGPERRLEIPEFAATSTALNFPSWVSSRDLIVNVWNGRQNRRLWRVSVSGRRKPEMLGELGEQIGIHTASRSGHKLAFSRGVYDTNIWRFDLSGSHDKAARARCVIASSRFDQQPALSPDGSKIAFETTRSGFSEIWIASRDGSHAVPLTHFETFAGSPRWSPDGTMIVLDGSRDDHTDADIYVVPASGGEPKRITHDPAADFMPSWSADGQWIYFCSTRTGSEEIWRIPASGGTASRLTFHGGFESVASPDGRWVYYSKGNSPISSLWRVPASGGEETMVADDIRSRSFDLTAKGLYFFAGSSPHSTELRLLNTASLKMSTIASFDRFLRERMSVSRNDDFLLYTQVDQQSNDLMLVDPLR